MSRGFGSSSSSSSCSCGVFLFLLCGNNTLIPFWLGALTKQNTCLMPASTPLLFANKLCDSLQREREGFYAKGGHEICDGFLLTKAFEFFMLQIQNFCRSGPDLLLISAQLHSRAYG